GIRDRNVTGVQTCALPISRGTCRHVGARSHRRGTRTASGGAARQRDQQSPGVGAPRGGGGVGRLLCVPRTPVHAVGGCGTAGGVDRFCCGTTVDRRDRDPLPDRVVVVAQAAPQRRGPYGRGYAAQPAGAVLSSVTVRITTGRSWNTMKEGTK